jgi:hypothetical protein
MRVVLKDQTKKVKAGAKLWSGPKTFCREKKKTPRKATAPADFI